MAKRSPRYCFTTTDLNDVNISHVKKAAQLKNSAEKFNDLTRAMNGETRGYVKRYRVVVRARLGKDSPYAHLYRRGAPLYRSSSQVIKKEHGSRFDVYLTPYLRWK